MCKPRTLMELRSMSEKDQLCAALVKEYAEDLGMPCLTLGMALQSLEDVSNDTSEQMTIDGFLHYAGIRLRRGRG